MTPTEQKAFDAMREALEESRRWHQGDKWRDSPKFRSAWEMQRDLINDAITAANAVSVEPQALVHVDWQDMYWKEKRRAEMWVAKYEKDIGPLEVVHPQATEPAWRPIETAPKDMGTYLFRSNKVAVQGFRDATGKLCVCIEAGASGNPPWRLMRRSPTHWMPLPAAPEAKQ